MAAKYHDNPGDSLLAVLEFVPIGDGRKLVAVSLLERDVRGNSCRVKAGLTATWISGNCSRWTSNPPFPLMNPLPSQRAGSHRLLFFFKFSSLKLPSAHKNSVSRCLGMCERVTRRRQIISNRQLITVKRGCVVQAWDWTGHARLRHRVGRPERHACVQQERLTALPLRGQIAPQTIYAYELVGWDLSFGVSQLSGKAFGALAATLSGSTSFVFLWSAFMWSKADLRDAWVCTRKSLRQRIVKARDGCLIEAGNKPAFTSCRYSSARPGHSQNTALIS